MEKEITKEKIQKYFELTSKALKKARENIISGRENHAKEIIEMVENYISDAKKWIAGLLAAGMLYSATPSYAQPESKSENKSKNNLEEKYVKSKSIQEQMSEWIKNPKLNSMMDLQNKQIIIKKYVFHILTLVN